MQFLRDMDANPFLLTGLIAGLLASVACGCIGPYVITRRIVFLSGAIAHIVVGGVGAVIFLRHQFGLEWLEPLHGAVVAALLAAFVVGLVQHYAKEQLDTLMQDKTTIMISHRFSSMATMDRIVVLDQGQILTVGTVDEVKSSDNQRVQNLLNRILEPGELDPEAYLRRLTGEDLAV